MRRVVGRLVEVRIVSPVHEADMPGVAAQTSAVIGSIDRHFVAVVDLRQARLFAQPVVDAFIQVLGATNPMLERSAFVIGGESAVFGLQIERAIITARNPARRAFRDPRELTTWLDEVLDAPERARLRAFLVEGGDGAA